MADTGQSRGVSSTPRGALPPCLLVGMLLTTVLCMATTAPLQAESFIEHFSGPNASWQVKSTEPAIRTVTHRRAREHGKDGPGELLVVETARDSQTLRLEHPLPKARVLNELEVALWVRSSCPGLQIHVRVIFPDDAEGAGGKPLSMLIPGETLEEAGGWQRLVCRTEDKLVQERLVLLRARQERKLTPRTMVIDRVVLTWPLQPGENEVALDELLLEPLVRWKDNGAAPGETASETPETPPVEFRLDRLEVEGKPFFPRLVVYHGEPVQELAGAGYNVIWVPDYTDHALLQSVRREGLWAAATPPMAGLESEPVGDSGLMPFAPQTRPIAFWMLGTRMSPRAQSRLLKWVDQVQEADRKFHRPLAADINGDEGVFSRELDLLGISRHTIGTSITLRDYRDWLGARRSWARPGSLCWTWIQAVPSPAVSSAWEHHQVPLQLEPEQLRLQVFAALAAGMRGIGFWTPRALREDVPADRETLLAIRQLNWELRLMEPWLATTNGVSRIPVGIETDRKVANQQPSRFQYKKNTDDPSGRNATRPPAEVPGKMEVIHTPELSAAVLRTDFGTLLLPMWLEDRAHFVPGQLAANKVSLIVPGIDETATAWEITTTGIHSIDRERVSGGVKLTLRNFDQTACILMTADRELIEQARQRIVDIEEPSARAWLGLADLKLERVRAADQQLSEWGLRQAEGPQWLGRARELYLEARAALSRQDWQRVRLRSQQALQMVRVLQRAHWDDAMQDVTSPLSSPFAVGFQSLPAQARFAMQLQHDPAEASQNLLPTGNFEDVHALTAIGWKHEQDTPDTIHADAELHPEAHQGQFGLRLYARTTQTQAANAASLSRELVSVATPAITVHAGHAVRISGWIRIPRELPGTTDGVMIFDSLGGRSLALRLREPCEWKRFELVREVLESQDMTVSLTLTGPGEAHVDDLQVTVHPLQELRQTGGEATGNRPRPAAGINRWPDLRRFNPLPNRTPTRTGPRPSR